MRNVWKELAARRHNEVQPATPVKPARYNKVLLEAMSNGKEPLRFEGEEVETARRHEEARGVGGCNETLTGAKRDGVRCRAILRHHEVGQTSQKKSQKRKGNIRNYVEENAINRINGKR